MVHLHKLNDFIFFKKKMILYLIRLLLKKKKLVHEEYKTQKKEEKKLRRYAHNSRHANTRNVIKEDTLELSGRSLQHHYIKRVMSKTMIS
jgi:hypothetical protein